MSFRQRSTQILLFGIVLSWGCSATNGENEESYSSVHSSSGISGRSFAQIVDELNNLEKKYPEMAKVFTYGTSVGGENLTLIRIGKNSTTTQVRPGVVIEGTIHGDEFLNIEDRLPRWFLENQNSPGVASYLDSGGVIWIAPILNPDGYAAHRRENDKGLDLNRDFDMKLAGKKGFTQPETTSLIKFLRKDTSELNVKLKLTMDYHCCVGALIYPWGYSATAQLPEPARSEHKRLAKMIIGNFPGYGSGRAQDVVNYVAIGAADDFYYDAMGASAFTFEGAFGREHRNFEKHTKMWDQLLADKAGDTQIAQAQNSSLALAIGSESEPGKLLTWLASTSQGLAYDLCEGKAVACLGSSPTIATSYSNPQKVGDRFFYKANEAVQVGDKAVYTVLEKSSSGTITSSASVQFIGR